MTAGHVLVTGGTGFIGSRLCASLLEKEWSVTVLTRDAHRARAILPQTVALVEKLDQLAKAPPVHGIINLAGAPLADRRWNGERKQLFYSSRVGLTEKLFEYFGAEAVPAPAVLVNGSAIGYYGPRGDETLDETAEPGKGFASDLCRSWESSARQFENLGTRVCRIRTGIVLGPGGGALKAMLPPFRLGLGGPIGSGRQWMSWIHREDIVEIICAALADSDLDGAINATAPTPVRNREFAKTLGRALSRPALVPLPAIAVKAMFGQMADELLLSGQKVLPRKLQGHGFAFRFAELEPALRSILARH